MPDLKFSFLNSFIFRFLGLYSALVFLFFAVSNVNYYFAEKRAVELEFSKRTYAIATTLAPHIPAKLLATIDSDVDSTTREFKQLRSILETAQLANGLDEDQLYILRPNKRQENVYEYAIMLQEKTFIGTTYSPPENVRELYRQAAMGKPQRIPLFEDHHGTFISSLAPIKNDKGETVAILEIDRNVAQYLQVVQKNMAYNIGLESLLFCALSILAFLMYKRLKEHLLNLLRATEGIQNNQYDYRVPVRTDDEFGRLGNALNLAMEALAQQFTMLKFIPPHTKRMIEASLSMNENVDLRMARSVEAAIMETDIRGFTALSENLTPNQTIQLVNQYIKVQANIILEYDGSIDKYMGDAVLVIFEGEEKEIRALSCALDIQKAVNDLNISRKNQISVEIGVGVSLGDVVLGNMGCEQRMEHTMIGSTVNLAARLCSQAKRGEVVIQEAISQKVGIKHKNEFVEVKGFSEPVSVIRFGKNEILSQLQEETLLGDATMV